ncbi:hypothetical protein ABZ608_35055 [Streptomyces sp. NPDC013172]|uniref:hypothetical protein n=1 Tax=Streptomyces sp. NPDC013172 TaxID=3155009 RepID=UPI0033C1080F
MIVLPQLLNELLDRVTEKRAGHLALDFAQHALDIRQGEIDEEVMAACRECLVAGHEAIQLGEATPRLLQAQESLYAVAERWEGNRNRLATGAGLTMQAVRVGCQRMLEEAREHVMRGSLLTCQDLAREIQSGIGAWCAEQTPDKGDDRRHAARRARWEEARWQVRHIIETEPAPGETGTER